MRAMGIGKLFFSIDPVIPGFLRCINIRESFIIHLNLQYLNWSELVEINILERMISL